MQDLRNKNWVVSTTELGERIETGRKMYTYRMIPPRYKTALVPVSCPSSAIVMIQTNRDDVKDLALEGDGPRPWV